MSAMMEEMKSDYTQSLSQASFLSAILVSAGQQNKASRKDPQIKDKLLQQIQVPALHTNYYMILQLNKY